MTEKKNWNRRVYDMHDAGDIDGLARFALQLVAERRQLIDNISSMAASIDRIRKTLEGSTS